MVWKVGYSLTLRGRDVCGRKGRGNGCQGSNGGSGGELHVDCVVIVVVEVGIDLESLGVL